MCIRDRCVHTIYDVGAIGVAWLLDSSLSVVIGLGIAGIAAKVLIVLGVVLACLLYTSRCV